VLATSNLLSYAIYCLHIPILHGMRVIDKHVSFSAKYGVSREAMAIVSTIFLAVVSALVVDRLKVQRNLAGFLKRIFEGGWWRGARVEAPLAQWSAGEQPAASVPPLKSALSPELGDCGNTGGS
jgi:peptidoglycan/LPS O-acetylase OafA/YrhL